MLDRTQRSPQIVDRTFDPALIQSLFAEVKALAVQLNRPNGDLQNGGKAILKVLSDHENCTVPQIARLTGTSRQNIQILVNRLLAQGCVELHPNAAHKRSPLIRPTTKALQFLVASDLYEDKTLNTILAGQSEERIHATVELLRQIRASLKNAPASPRPMRASNPNASAGRRRIAQTAQP